jgi:hypothetical protein
VYSYLCHKIYVLTRRKKKEVFFERIFFLFFKIIFRLSVFASNQSKRSLSTITQLKGYCLLISTGYLIPGYYFLKRLWLFVVSAIFQESYFISIIVSSHLLRALRGGK